MPHDLILDLEPQKPRSRSRYSIITRSYMKGLATTAVGGVVGFAMEYAFPGSIGNAGKDIAVTSGMLAGFVLAAREATTLFKDISAATAGYSRFGLNLGITYGIAGFGCLMGVCQSSTFIMGTDLYILGNRDITKPYEYIPFGMICLIPLMAPAMTWVLNDRSKQGFNEAYGTPVVLNIDQPTAEPTMRDVTPVDPNRARLTDRTKIDKPFKL